MEFSSYKSVHFVTAELLVYVDSEDSVNAGAKVSSDAPRASSGKSSAKAPGVPPYPDLLVCGEPIILCRVLHLRFPKAAVVSYAAQQLSMYFGPGRLVQQALREIKRLGELDNTFFATQGRVVVEWHRFQAGVRSVAIRPTAAYLEGAFWSGAHNPKILLLRQVSLFWDPECVLNFYLRQASAIWGREDEDVLGIVGTK